MNAQGIATRAAMPAQPNGVNLGAMLDCERQRFGWPPIEKCTKGHVYRSERQKVAWILPYPPPLELPGAKTNHLPNIQGESPYNPLYNVARNKNSYSDLADSALGTNESKFVSSHQLEIGISSGSFRGLPTPPIESNA
jgi:hypothetical protein